MTNAATAGHSQTPSIPTFPMPAWPHYDEDEIAAVTRVLRSGRVNYWTGTEARSFEREYAAALGVSHAVSLANGTVALELALQVLGIGNGDDVVTTPRTFIASASCAVLRGARPVFADVDRDSQNITAGRFSSARSHRVPRRLLRFIWRGGPVRWMPSSISPAAGTCRSLRTARRRMVRATSAGPSALGASSGHSHFVRTRSLPPAARVAC